MSIPVGDAADCALIMGAVLSMLFAAAVWVRSDAKANVAQGNSIAFSAGPIEVNTPTAWFIACLILGEVFVPLYMDART